MSRDQRRDDARQAPRSWERSATLRPACKEGSCMDPTRLLQAPYGPRFGDGVRQEPSMERRTFMALVSGGLLAAPLAAKAQQAAKIYRIGIVLEGGPYYAAIDGL